MSRCCLIGQLNGGGRPSHGRSEKALDVSQNREALLQGCTVDLGLPETRDVETDLQLALCEFPYVCAFLEVADLVQPVEVGVLDVLNSTAVRELECCALEPALQDALLERVRVELVQLYAVLLAGREAEPERTLLAPLQHSGSALPFDRAVDPCPVGSVCPPDQKTQCDGDDNP